MWNQPNPRSQHNPHLQLLCSICPQSTDRKITLSRNPYQLGTVETALCTIDQTIALLGPNPHDPHLQPNGKLIFALKCQFQSYENEVPPATCVEPLPVELIELVVQACHASYLENNICIAIIITSSYFFLCCLREHTVTFDNEPFKLSNVQVYKDDKPVHIQSSKLLHTADFLTLTFDTQKNGIKGKHISQRHTTSATLCLILTVAHWVAHLNLHKARPHQPLCSYHHTASSSYLNLAFQDIIQELQASALHHLHVCVNPSSVERHSLCPSNAMALFSCRVDSVVVNHVGCWCWDAMLRYLHVQSCPIISRLSKLMLAGGNFQLFAKTATMPLPNPSHLSHLWADGVPGPLP